MKQIIFIFGIISITTIVHAQDMIFKKNGEVLEGKIFEINETSVKYKKKTNLDGPTYTIDKSNIIKIRYENGVSENISSDNKENTNTSGTTKTQSQDKDSAVIASRKNYLGMDAFQYVNTSIGIAYQRFLGKYMNWSVNIPITIGFAYMGNNNLATEPTDYLIYQRGKIFATGIDLYYFPTGQGRLKYFVGPYFEWGIFKYQLTDYVYNNYNMAYYPQAGPVRSDGQHIAGGITNGFYYQLNNRFLISSSLGLGLKKDETYSSNDKVVTHVKFNVMFGFRFNCKKIN